MKKLSVLLIMLIPIILAAQGIEGDAGILYTFANGQITESGGINYFEFDIMAQATPVEQGNLTRLGDGVMWLYYNTNAFGTNIYTNDNVTVTRGTLLYAPPPFTMYGVYLNDTGDTHQTPTLPLFALTFEYLGDVGYGTPLPATPTQLLHVKIKIQDTSEQPWVCIWDVKMPGESFYDDHWTWYSPVEIGACLYYQTPTPVELSSFTASLSAESYVKLTWVTQSETNMTGYYILRGTSDDLNSAQMVSPLIPATNTSSVQTYEFTDSEVYEDGVYYYWLEARETGTSNFHGPVSIAFSSTSTTPATIPLQTALNKIYPNPFNPFACIPFSIGKDAGPTPVSIQIYNARGQIVYSDDLGIKNPGNYKDYVWDGKDMQGRDCGTGMYMVRMIAGKTSFTQKVVMIK
ncbi:MAG TPA: T9SS type A sorting domain-containing protein [Candidatus Cloacimonadota bacterium]|jgi:hypothetical protein|nr:T9SS type A sorting domain-containing protein [Candidatus Cloacimonadota bacterium]HOG30722.1 T9SS type A sorting domain-containing protein [Candidatus Cloacimonadota bacterium]HOR59050.1 T9SS type A sorting domain-containing protein [Candidatus Cloacimonadota bacterium]HPB08650.1 T9SS type A sorting domain-containing protein [Candidatus Cloacimonadota bacterium]HPL23040.1 T9SS type A sorting domain-containing protein [Candidatus Cloacimonadota bacterium]